MFTLREITVDCGAVEDRYFTDQRSPPFMAWQPDWGGGEGNLCVSGGLTCMCTCVHTCLPAARASQDPCVYACKPNTHASQFRIGWGWGWRPPVQTATRYATQYYIKVADNADDVLESKKYNIQTLDQFSLIF